MLSSPKIRLLLYLPSLLASPTASSSGSRDMTQPSGAETYLLSVSGMVRKDTAVARLLKLSAQTFNKTLML